MTHPNNPKKSFKMGSSQLGFYVVSYDESGGAATYYDAEGQPHSSCRTCWFPSTAVAMSVYKQLTLLHKAETGGPGAEKESDKSVDEAINSEVEVETESDVKADPADLMTRLPGVFDDHTGFGCIPKLHKPSSDRDAQPEQPEPPHALLWLEPIKGERPKLSDMPEDERHVVLAFGVDKQTMEVAVRRGEFAYRVYGDGSPHATPMSPADEFTVMDVSDRLPKVFSALSPGMVVRHKKCFLQAISRPTPGRSPMFRNLSRYNDVGGRPFHVSGDTPITGPIYQLRTDGDAE